MEIRASPKTAFDTSPPGKQNQTAMFEIKGIIHHISEVEYKGEKQFAVRLFVLKNEGQYTDYYPFELTGDKTSLADGFEVGQEVLVNFHVRGRQWQDRWFTSLSPFKIEAAQGGGGAPDGPPIDNALYEAQTQEKNDVDPPF